jgi:hypothetical protein
MDIYGTCINVLVCTAVDGSSISSAAPVHELWTSFEAVALGAEDALAAEG